MADPLSIIGGIAAILNLISFGYKIVSVAADLHDSTGELDVNSEENVIVNDMEAILGNLRPINGAEKNDFEPLRQRALIIATELKTALDKLKIDGNHSKWKTIKVAIRNIWDRKKVQELDQRLRGLTLELNTHLTANSSEALKKMSGEQQQRFRAVHTQITNIQTQIAQAFGQQNYIFLLFLSELERQSLQIRESATNDTKNLQSSITAQLSVLKDATSEVARQNDKVQDKLELMKKGDNRLRATLESVIQAGNNIQSQLSRVERLVKAASAPDDGVSGNELAKAQNALQKGYDLFAQYTFERTEVTLIEALAECKNPSGISTTGHTYSGTSLLTGEGTHIRGNLGKSEQNIDSGGRHLYSGNTTVSGKAIAISGNVSDPEFLPWNKKG